MDALKNGLALGASMLALAAATMPAAAQSWNMYSQYTDTVTLSFLKPITSPVQAGQFAALNLTLPQQQQTSQLAIPVTVDTGSTGLVLGQKYINTTNLTPLGPGSIIFTSDNQVHSGTFYSLPVTLSGNAGSTGTATANVKVLVVPNGDIAQLGVGFDRGGNISVNPVFPGVDQNAFFNITAINGQPVTNMRTGYVITASGVVLGLTGNQASNYAMVKLTPNTFYPPNVWNRPQMGMTINNVPVGVGDFLPDTGIAYMLVTPPVGVPTTTPCPAPAGTCVQSGLPVQVALLPTLPGQNLAFGFNVGVASPMTPLYVNLRGVDSSNLLNVLTPVSLNSGEAFYLGFDYLVDFAGGYVGYRSTGASNVSGFMPLLSLQNIVSLPGGFAATLPVFLAGDTTLAPIGQSSFSAPLMGFGRNLFIAGNGSVAFNAPVEMGGGTFNVQQGVASINSSLAASGINVGPQGVMSGSGVIFGNVVNAGAITPGNSIGTMTIAGAYVQTGSGSYVAEVGNSGQSDRINVVGPATLGGAVNVVAVPGSTFGARTTYTLLNATAGLTGTFASVADPYPFLLPSLSYDPNNVYLTLQIGGFAAAAQTQAQYAVGRVLDANVNTASGDFAQVLSAMASNTQSLSLGQAILTSLSGQNYSTFSSTMVQGAQLFMNNFANQTGGGGSPVSNRVALAEACDVACDVTPQAMWGAWGGALGGLGTIGANAGTGAVTYNVGGFAAGLDRMVAPGLRIGVTSGYTTGTQWTSGFTGAGMTDTFLAGLYGGYRMDKVYADAVLGYAYSYNQMWRQIIIPGLQQRTAQGRTGANQWYGQIEGGYRFDIGTAADAYITPFMRWQGYTGAQNGFTETGAQSLNLTVAGQTTN
jgi:uncharacterized protein with beta-barrel porin domain